MLLIISPAKSLNFDKVALQAYTQPKMLKQSELLIKTLKKLKKEDLMGLMDISDKIAALNVERFKNFAPPFTLDNAKQAILAFDGDVYDGLQANDFSEAEFEFAQTHLRILSGLYGVLRPLDLMQAYRLEMGTSLENSKGKNLYAFWGDSISKELNTSLPDAGDAIVNLASNEYWSSVQETKLKAPVYTIHFKEKRGDVYKVISFSAKKARGAMCRYAIKNRLTKPEDLKKFDWDAYQFSETLSSEKEWVFVR